jgi:hypothetical protein
MVSRRKEAALLGSASPSAEDMPEPSGPWSEGNVVAKTEPKGVTCPVCGKKFSNVEKRNKHKDKEHKK